MFAPIRDRFWKCGRPIAVTASSELRLVVPGGPALDYPPPVSESGRESHGKYRKETFCLNGLRVSTSDAHLSYPRIHDATRVTGLAYRIAAAGMAGTCEFRHAT
jgi:hypothetical protein